MGKLASEVPVGEVGRIKSALVDRTSFEQPPERRPEQEHLRYFALCKDVQPDRFFHRPSGTFSALKLQSAAHPAFFDFTWKR
jgi:hypothetical protein